MSAMCPHCGFNLKADEPLRLGEWDISIREVRRAGVHQKLSRQQIATLYSIAKGLGKPVKAEALGSRTSNAEDPTEVVRVIIRRLRRSIPDIPIETVWGLGYRWSGDLAA